MDKKRIEWIDITKTIAIFLVVLTHSTEEVYGYFMYGNGVAGKAEYLCASIGFVLGRLGVPLFIFTSGFLLFNKSFYSLDDVICFYKKNLLPIFITNFAWVIIYNIFDKLYFHIQVTPIEIIKEVLGLQIVPNMWHMWYIPCLFFLYFITPLVSYILKKLPKMFFWFILVFAIGYCFVLPTLLSVKSIFAINIPCINSITVIEFGGITWFIVYAVIGNKITYSIKSTLMPISFIALTIGIQYVSFVNGVKYLMWYNNILILAAAFSLFRMLANIELSDSSVFQMTIRSFFEFMGKHSFAVFYIHMIIRHLCSPWIAWMSINRAIRVLVLEVVCILGSILVIVLIEQLKIKPLNRVLLFQK